MENCDICDGTGEVEILEYYTDENGYSQAEGTGKFKPCPECNV